MIELKLKRDGVCLLPAPVSDEIDSRLETIYKVTFENESAACQLAQVTGSSRPLAV